MESPPVCVWQPKDQHQLPGSHGNYFFKILNLISFQIMNSRLAVFLEYLLSVALLQMHSSWLSLDGMIILSHSIQREFWTMAWTTHLLGSYQVVYISSVNSPVVRTVFQTSILHWQIVRVKTQGTQQTILLVKIYLIIHGILHSVMKFYTVFQILHKAKCLKDLSYIGIFDEVYLKLFH